MTAVAYGEKGVPYDSSDLSEMLVQKRHRGVQGNLGELDADSYELLGHQSLPSITN